MDFFWELHDCTTLATLLLDIQKTSVSEVCGVSLEPEIARQKEVATQFGVDSRGEPGSSGDTIYDPWMVVDSRRRRPRKEVISKERETMTWKEGSRFTILSHHTVEEALPTPSVSQQQ
ncbi:hypothetical protein V6N12_028753 [Hibiscus sabdariffa]|uniref:Uncharacterized protein n=1 Tax=Hibiscus sabdariffa TaxID=183260 RepID=A0ABR2F6Q3_9ROSI